MGEENSMINILIVDDSGVIRSSIKNLLEGEGYSVYEATSLSDLKYNTFSNKIKLNELNLILLDFYLQNETGLEVIEFLNSKKLDIPIVMMTGEGKRDIVIKSIKLGAKDYLLKPFDHETLIKKVDFVLNIKNLKMDQKSYEKEMKVFEKNLSLEVERAIRSKLELCIARIILPSNEIIGRDIIKKQVRDIDQVYIVNKMKAVCIFPFTDEKGFEIVKGKIEKSLDLYLNNNSFSSKTYFFKGNEKDIVDIEKKDIFCKEIIKFLDLG